VSKGIVTMNRSDRLFKIMQLLRGGSLYRAKDIAEEMGVSLRTIYRDMDKLIASGVQIEGSRGAGYRAHDVTTLPPIALSQPELEVLNLALAIVEEAGDPEIRMTAKGLVAKIETALPERSIDAQEAWKFAKSPFADAARGFSYMPLIRAAIKAKQKLQITYNSKGDRITSRTVHPLQLEYWGRVWTLTAWCEARTAFRVFRVDLIQTAEARPEMFVDEEGKRLADFQA
jgi:predicted DNA-binding transcriptional regulator YafY